MEGQSITLLQILQVGGLAGVVSALVGGVINEYFEWRDRRRKVRYLALRISLILEKYYNDCAGRVVDIENFISSRGAVGANEVGLPKPADFPEDPVAWIYLDESVTDEVLSLPAAIRSLNEGIWFDVDMDGAPGGPDPTWTLGPLYEMAFRSIRLARRVRSMHGLSEIHRTDESEKWLRESREKFEKRREFRRRSDPEI
jgi:hypothetical protein